VISDALFTLMTKIKLTLLLLALGILYSCNDADSTNETVDALNSEIASLKKQLTEQSPTPTDSLSLLLKEFNKQYKSLYQLSTGELQRVEANDKNASWGYEYRVEVYISEIYKSIYLTKIDYYGEGLRYVSSSYKIDIEKELGLFGESTNSLEFKEWVTPTKFRLITDENVYTMSIFGPREVTAKD